MSRSKARQEQEQEQEQKLEQEQEHQQQQQQQQEQEQEQEQMRIKKYPDGKCCQSEDEEVHIPHMYISLLSFRLCLSFVLCLRISFRDHFSRYFKWAYAFNVLHAVWTRRCFAVF